jgi:NAD(P)-dependent dehydrogenase (short-subunit alcohol dehydrogenase family)
MARKALVTGSSRGIGRSIALALAERGVQVALHCQGNRAAAEETRKALKGAGHAVFAADLGSPQAIASLWADVQEKLGPLDVLVNNAGVYTEHPPLETDAEEWLRQWRRTLDINLLAPAQLSHLAAQAMAARGGGRIVNVSSRGAFRGEPLGPAYGASKAGLNSMGQSMAKGLASRKVFVYTVAPGWVETDMATESLQGPQGKAILADQPLGRIARPEEIAAVVAFCAIEAPESMSGGIIDVNGASYLRT